MEDNDDDTLTSLSLTVNSQKQHVLWLDWLISLSAVYIAVKRFDFELFIRIKLYKLLENYHFASFDFLFKKIELRRALSSPYNFNRDGVQFHSEKT